MRGSLGKGLHYEQLASAWLSRRGLRLIEANFHCRFGEIDLIMQDRDTICFVEVKYRRTAAFGGAAAAIPPAKQRKLIRSAQCFLATSPALADRPLRFDALLIQREGNGDERIEWLKNAISCEDPA